MKVIPTNSIHLRPIEKSDIDFLKDMLFEAIFIAKDETPLPRSILEKEGLRKYYEDWGKATDVGFVAQLKGEPIGAVWSRQFVESNKGYAYVNDQTPELGIAVFPAYRNQGVGNKLLDKLLKELMNRQIKAVSLSVDSRNPAVNLYKRLGFKVIQQEVNSIIMLLKLFCEK